MGVLWIKIASWYQREGFKIVLSGVLICKVRSVNILPVIKIYMR